MRIRDPDSFVLTDMTLPPENDRAASPGRSSHALPRDPAVWAWLIVALLALLPARAALHIILA